MYVVQGIAAKHVHFGEDAILFPVLLLPQTQTHIELFRRRLGFRKIFI